MDTRLECELPPKSLLMWKKFKEYFKRTERRTNKMENEEDKCIKCGNPITNDNLGWGLDKGNICMNCHLKQLEGHINVMNQFRKTEDFKDSQKLKVKLLEIDESLELHDIPYHNFKQSADFYYGYTLVEMQKVFLDKLISFIENTQEETKDESKFEELRLELKEFFRSL